MDRHQRIARVHDLFAAQGYRTLTERINQYALPKVLPGILEEQGINQTKYEVLDLACGPGNLKDYTHFRTYRGVDLSPRMLKEAGETGYSELTQADILEYIRLAPDNSTDGILCLSATYFLSPEELQEFVQHLNRIARIFWIITLDGITEAVQEIYQEEEGIPTYNHRGTTYTDLCVQQTTIGWLSARTHEEIPVDILMRKRIL